MIRQMVFKTYLLKEILLRDSEDNTNLKSFELERITVNEERKKYSKRLNHTNDSNFIGILISL